MADLFKVDSEALRCTQVKCLFDASLASSWCSFILILNFLPEFCTKFHYRSLFPFCIFDSIPWLEG